MEQRVLCSSYRCDVILIHVMCIDDEIERFIRAPMIATPAPLFTATAVMPNKDFKDISLSDYIGKWVVLFFYPKDFTFICPTEIIAFGDRVAEFAALNTQVIAASADSKYSHLAWINKPRSEGGLGHMNIPIISDFDKRISIKYGVLTPDGSSLRGLFLISTQGKIRHITMNDDQVGRNVDEIIRLIKAFQFNEAHGDVCPANWKPGDKTITADPVGSKAYFKGK